MFKVLKLSKNFKTFSNVRRYQFKRHEPICYPKRTLSRDDLKPTLVQERACKLQSDLTNYYKILGIGKRASSQEIKAAYYKLAKKFHPDKNRTPQQTKSFQQISEAYHVLSDDVTRYLYDECGVKKTNQVYLNTLGKNAFGRESRKRNYSEKRIESVDANKNDLAGYGLQNDKIEMKIKFITATLGGKEYIDLKAITNCPKCKGSTNINNQINIEFCQECGGTGHKQCKDDSQKYKLCNVCNGKRYVNRNTCGTCDNRGYIVRSKRMELNVPPGTATGDILTIKNPLTNQIVKIVVDVEKSKSFKREGNNIYSVKYLTISQAVLGGKFSVRGLYKKLEVNLGPGTESHTNHCFKGKGIIPLTGPPGDHIVQFKIRIPKYLTTKQRQLILALSRTEDPTFDEQ